MSTDFRFSFTFLRGNETLRAYLLFGALSAVLGLLATHLAGRELSLRVLAERLDLGRYEARRVASAIENLGGPGGTAIDFDRVRERRSALERFIGDRMAGRGFISHIEVRDRFGVRQLRVDRQGAAGPPGTSLPPPDWPTEGVQVVREPLRQAEGEVRVGVEPSLLPDEIAQLRRSLRMQVVAAAGVALLVLVAGFFYVLFLIRKTRRLEEARQAADRASQIGLLASQLAHDVRNPLNAMSLNLEMLEDELTADPAFDGSEPAELLDSTKREVKRLDQLVTNYLTWARPSDPHFERRDLNQVVRDVLQFLDGDFRRSGVRLQPDLAQLLPTVDLDEGQFKQVLINLLVNARQILRDRPDAAVVVRTRAGANGEAVLEVEDNGPGIAADQQRRIFDVFFSARGGGTGLGLPIARQIVERHGGSIDVESTVGRGATFRVRLPRRHEKPERRATPIDVGR